MRFSCLAAMVALLAVTVACGSGPDCGGGLFEPCEVSDPAGAQMALKRPEAKLVYPDSRLLNLAATGLIGGRPYTQARVTRIWQQPPGAAFALVVEYYDMNLTALGWHQAPEPANTAFPAAPTTADVFVRWIRPGADFGDLFILTSALLPAGEYRAQLTVNGVGSAGNDEDSFYISTPLDSPDPRTGPPARKASPSR
jgi:hypothetical protein